MKSRITPIHKKGPNDNMNNYRPIAILPIFSKILEKCMYSRLMSFFFNEFDVLFKCQFGFNH